MNYLQQKLPQEVLEFWFVILAGNCVKKILILTSFQALNRDSVSRQTKFDKLF